MKTSGNHTNPSNKQGKSQTPRPEIRDNLDSRKNEEQETKGDDMTSNKKETRNNKQRKKKDKTD